MDRIKEIYESLKNGKIKVAFIGRNTTKDYLCYVLGNGIRMSYCGSADDLTGEEDVCIFDDVTGRIEGELGDHGVKLSDFIRILNMDMPQIPQDRPVALWGGGDELKARYKTIRKYCNPSVIIDKCKTGKYEGIPFVRPEEIEFKNYFIVITTMKYAGEIKDELERHGCAEGKDYIMGLIWKFLNNNNNAEMFMKTITDRPIKKVLCRRPFEFINIVMGGNLMHCCYPWLPEYVGNILDDRENTFDTISSRIIRVSFMNQTYSFCDTACCALWKKERHKLIESDKEAVDPELYLKEQKIVDVDVSFDSTCNLHCKSCRREVMIDRSNLPLDIARQVAEDLVPNARRVTIAGYGEVFFSKAYTHILSGTYPNVRLLILSNGVLFTMDQWRRIKGRFKEISLSFSIDAATKETYEMLRRGGKWENVIRGLETASDLKRRGEISLFFINFVVSRDNYREMPAFVQLGIDMGCDKVHFTRILNTGSFTDEEFQEVTMFCGDKPNEELQAILDLPIMKDPIVKYMNIPQSTVK